MLCEDEKWHPCAFLSKGLNDVERNYDVHDKELLGIMRALEGWRHHLEGATHELEIWTDHRNLQYFMSAKKLNRRQARWSLFLSRFNFHLVHKAGTLMKKADVLSRRVDHKRGVEEDNANITLLKPEYFRVCALRQGHLLIDGSEKAMLSKIRQCTDMDEEVVKAVREMKEGKKNIRGEEWVEEQGLILFRGKVYVPRDVELRTEIIRLHHNTSISGHPGRWKTLELVMRNYWWPGISKFVLQYVDGCDTCQRGKSYPEMPAGKLMPNPTPTSPWVDISVDFVTGLPEAEGYDAILVVCDRYTKQVHIIPTTTETSSLGLARLYRDHIWKLHGLPNTVISDRGPQFASAFMKELNKMLGIETKLSTAYHPQTDGQTERMNQELEQYLRMFVNYRQSDWPEWLAIAEFSYNNKIQTSTRTSPFYANYGYNPRMGFEPRRKAKVQSVEEFVQKLKSVQAEVEAALHKARDDMKKYADRKRMHAPQYKPGDKVWLSTKDLATTRPSRKLMEKQIGPYTITDVISPNAVKLKLPRSIRIDAPINVSRLRPYKPPTLPGQQITPQSPIEIEGEPEYEVEQILDSRLRRNKLQFLVKWKGYTNENNSWEPEENCSNAHNAIAKFYGEYPNAPRRIAKLQFENLEFRPYENYTEYTGQIISRLEVET
jgi:transposase InsO family protein